MSSSGPGSSTRSWPIVVGLVALVAVLGAVAFLGGDDDGGAAALEGLSAPSVEGQPLSEGTSGATGSSAPVATGVNFDGEQVRVPADRPTVTVFLAHWCPHCRREVPRVQDWLDQGGLPEGVEMTSVATAIDPSRPNYPPNEWLEAEEWTPPVLVDTNGAVADAYGLSGFPYWVFTNADGEVVGRRSGELSIEQLEAAVSQLSG